jgi:hypothetical protein
LKAGQGVQRLPAWEGESAEHYAWRLAKHDGWKVGPEPPVTDEPERQPSKEDE